MTFDVFQVDWITIDIIIIVLLILLLIGVKVLKEIYRWRFFFSNVSTIRKVDNLQHINNQFSSISIKKCNLTKSSVFQQEKLIKPTIILIRRYRKLMLLKALTEAFCTFGYNVINLRLKMLTKNMMEQLIPDIEKELQQTFPAILTFHNQYFNLLSQNYNVIDFTKKVLPLNLLLKDYHCRNIILINPRLKSYNLEVYLTLLNDSNKNPKLSTIFSEKLNPFFKNKKVKTILHNNETFKYSPYTIIQKTKSTFKYYETLLLSVIFRYIEKQ
ncbi:MAG TPA: hypothetical protein VMV43_09740 [Candidatus Nanopelagicaceae bacterium]|nr:hypothetical protein [Candidatus Nanopelagicaceae bacterium]